MRKSVPVLKLIGKGLLGGIVMWLEGFGIERKYIGIM
jgi:hypothetical protein